MFPKLLFLLLPVGLLLAGCNCPGFPERQAGVRPPLEITVERTVTKNH